MRDQMLLERALSMRRELTAPERLLWHALRAQRLDCAKFRRQVVIGRYVADFACRIPKMLIVEVDGETHAGQEEYHLARSICLRERGYEVTRFTNSDVMTNLDGVLVTIQEALRTPPLPGPLP